MQALHPNIALIEKVDIADIPGCATIFHTDVIWRFFNPKLPDLAGDYHGVDGLTRFFTALADLSDGSFAVDVRNAWPIGDELVVVQTQNSATLFGEPQRFDVVLVWRIVEGKIAEVWDIPAVFSAPSAA